MKKKEIKTKGRYDVDFRYNLKIYWSFLRNYKGPFILITIILLINELLNLIQNLLFKKVVDSSTAYGSKSLTLEIFTSILITIAIIYLINTLIKVIIKWYTAHIQNKLEGFMIKDLKQRFFNRIITLSHSFHISHKTGALISRINRGSSAMERMTDFLIYNVFPVIFQIIITGISLIYLDKMSALIISIIMAIFVVYTFYLQQIQRKQNQIVNRAEDIEKANLSDIMTNIDSVKYFGKEEMIKQKYRNLTQKTQNELMKLWNYGRWMDSIQNLIVWMGTFFLVFFSVRNYIKGDITLGTLTYTYSVYGSFMWGYISSFMNGIRGYYRAMVDFHELFQYGKIEQEVKDCPGAKPINIKEGKIDFKDKTYSGMGKLIEEINGISNGDKYWIYYVNGQKANIGISNYKIKAGDVVSWKYEKNTN